MTYEEKLDLILSALSEARKGAVKDQPVKLYISEGNGLSQIGKDETLDILRKLQIEEKILSLNYIYNRLLPASQQPKNLPYLLIDIRVGFDKWYSDYLIQRRTSIENLTESNFKEIYIVLTQIEEQLQINQSDSFNFGFVSSTQMLEGYEAEDVDNLMEGYVRILDYLKKLGVIKDYSHGVMSVDADITLNISNYYELLDKVKTIKSKEDKPIENQMPIQKSKNKMTYDPQKGTLELEGKKVKFDKDSFRAKLLELLLKDDKSRKKEWSWDEVIEKIEDITDPDVLKENKQKFYSACDGLSKHIAQKIGINDFLIYNKSTVQIKPKYL